MVDTRTLKVYVGKIIDWILYIGLVFGSTFLMMDCLIKYRDSSTYFEVTNKKGESVELPTITICFEPAYKQTVLKEFNLTFFPSIPNSTKYSMKDFFERSSYEIGQDFLISIVDQPFKSITVDKLGKAEISKSSLFDVEISSLINQHLGKSYKLLMTSRQKDIKFAYLLVKLILKDHVVSKPKNLKVRVCSICRIGYSFEY